LSYDVTATLPKVARYGNEARLDADRETPRRCRHNRRSRRLVPPPSPPPQTMETIPLSCLSVRFSRCSAEIKLFFRISALCLHRTGVTYRLLTGGQRLIP